MWKDIRKAPRYEINNLGVIRNKKSKKIKKPFDHKGYDKIQLYGNENVASYRVHRLVAEAFLPDYSEHLSVDHIDRVRKNNKVENLRMVSHRENSFNRSIGITVVDDIIEWYKSGLSAEEIKSRLSH